MKKFFIVSLMFLPACCSKSNKLSNCPVNSNIVIENNNQSKGIATMVSSREKTTSGLEYEIINPGTGESPKSGDNVSVHYTGWLMNKDGQQGAKFDSSVDRGEPFEFPIGQGYVIKGWDEGVMLMKVGEKRRLIIPSNLGYGTRGAGAVIPPNATLIFDVELLKVS